MKLRKFRNRGNKQANDFCGTTSYQKEAEIARAGRSDGWDKKKNLKL